MVDGSNLAYDGRPDRPSFAQLMSAVDDLRTTFTGADITVVVDATFPYKIERAEVGAFRTAETDGQLVSTPAGTVGRGDALVCAIAQKAMHGDVDVQIVTNDSYKDLQDAHPWLLDPDRIVGGKSVQGVGWVWLPRVMVRSTSPHATPRRQPAPALTTVAGPPLEEEAGREDRVEGSTPGTAEPGAPAPTGVADEPVVEQAGLFTGAIVEGVVSGLVNYGAFVHLAGGARGLIHISELADGFSKGVGDVVRTGDTVFVTVLGRTEKGALALSLRRANTSVLSGAFDPVTYGMPADYDEEGQYVFPQGFDAGANEWLPGFEAQRTEWERQYAEAQARWQRHRDLMGNPEEGQ